jgi:hypothetical protein
MLERRNCGYRNTAVMILDVSSGILPDVQTSGF